MTNNTITLDFSLLEGLEPGTEDFGVANLKMIMDFALQTIDDITWLASVAHDKGEIDTPVVGFTGITKYIASELYDQSVHHAEIWAKTCEDLYPELVKFWVENNRSCYVTSDAGLWVDMAELKAELAKQKASS